MSNVDSNALHVFSASRRSAPFTNLETGDWRATATDEDLILESWSQGVVVGALMIMGCITVANMRRHVLLHKLILAEQLLAMTHGTFCFMDWSGYGYYLSSTAALLYISYFLHNVVAWMKIKPFFDGRTIFKPVFVLCTKRIYWCTLICTIPPLIFQIYDNFRFFNGKQGWYRAVRPYEPLMRDPWWLFCCLILFHVLSRVYGMGVFELVKRSPRFGILLAAIILAVIFTILDIIASIHSFTGGTDGINPWWKLSLVFKCLTDTIMLDDFKTELKRLGVKRIKRDEKRRQSVALVLDENNPDLVHTTDEESSLHDGSHPDPLTMNCSPNRPRPGQSGNPYKRNARELEFGDALNIDPSRLDRLGSVDTRSEHNRKDQSPRTQIGRGGKLAAKLPTFKTPPLFEAIKPGRRNSRKRSEMSSVDVDLERGRDHDHDLEKDLGRDGDVSPTNPTARADPSSSSTCPDDGGELDRARRTHQETLAALKRSQRDTSSKRRLDSFRASLAGLEVDPGTGPSRHRPGGGGSGNESSARSSDHNVEKKERHHV